VNDKLETQFLTVFHSNPESVVIRKALLGADEKGKCQAQYVTLRRGPNVSDVRHHFAGESCLVMKPTLPDRTCAWACIDVDVYDDIEVTQINTDVKKLGLPLSGFLSKSGGLHLFVFFEKPVAAAFARWLLRGYAEQLGFSPDVEIFPKSVGHGRLDYGVAVPFFKKPALFGNFRPTYAPQPNGDSYSEPSPPPAKPSQAKPATAKEPPLNRNIKLTAFAGSMRAKGFGEPAIRAALSAENKDRYTDPLPEDEVRGIAHSVAKYEQGEAPPRDAEPETSDNLPQFPEAGWRGIFNDYRNAMSRSSEASDSFHFYTLWASIAVKLGRRVWFEYGGETYPNVFLINYGPSGDKKTSSIRRAPQLNPGMTVIHGGGSAEGLGDEFADHEPGEGFLILVEELAVLLKVGQWTGSNLYPMLVNCFDCPPEYSMKFRKKPIRVERPTPSLLSATTPIWFWESFRPRDFASGMGNRFLFGTGAKKQPIALPTAPDLSGIVRAIGGLENFVPTVCHLDNEGIGMFGEFYRAWTEAEKTREDLSRAATQRLPGYILKLGMAYSCLEETVPLITSSQLNSAILVAKFAESCVVDLLASQHQGASAKKDLEQRIVDYVRTHPGVTRRTVRRALQRHYDDLESFNRTFEYLVKAQELFIQKGWSKRGTVTVDPI
jgi:hypothetical protein